MKNHYGKSKKRLATAVLVSLLLLFHGASINSLNAQHTHYPGCFHDRCSSVRTLLV